jgi:hypothetical protein
MFQIVRKITFLIGHYLYIDAGTCIFTVVSRLWHQTLEQTNVRHILVTSSSNLDRINSLLGAGVPVIARSADDTELSRRVAPPEEQMRGQIRE